MRGQTLGLVAWFIASLGAVLLTAGHARAQGRIDLKYIFNEGEAARSRLTIENTTKTEESISGSSWQQRQKQEFVFRVQTTHVDVEGVGTIQMTIESLKASTERSGQGTTEFDSTKPRKAGAASAGEDQLAALIGQSLTMVVAPDGAVREMRGVDIIARAMTAQLGENPLASGLVEGLTGAVADDALREALQAGMRVLPGRPVGRGETWTTQFSQSLGMLGAVKSKWKHRLASIERKKAGEDQISQIARIESEVQIAVGDAGDKRPSRRGVDAWTELAPGLKVRFDKAKGTATTLFDVTRGRAIKSESAMTMPIEVKVEGLEGAIDKPTMRQEVESLMTHELLPDEPRR